MKYLFILICLFFCGSKLTFANSSVKKIKDPKVASELKRHDALNNEFQKNKCPSIKSLTEMMNCTCKNFDEYSEIMYIKIDAFRDLLKRKPELKGEMVKVEGVFGNVVLEDKPRPTKDQLKAKTCRN